MTPLRVMPIFGLLLVVGSIAGLVGLTVNSLVNGVPFPGFGTIMAVVIMTFGVLLCFLSVIGIYVGLIFEQVRQRPLYLINRQWGPGNETDETRRVSANTNKCRSRGIESHSTPADCRVAIAGASETAGCARTR